MAMSSRSTLSLIRSNRYALRQRGIGATGLLILEALAYKAPSGFVRLSVAALGRMVGVGRSTALRHVQRLEACGAVTRLGPAILLNVRSVLSWCAEAVKERAAHAKRLFAKRKSQHVSTRHTHREEYTPQASSCLELSREEALRQLQTTYVPFWQRRNI